MKVRLLIPVLILLFIGNTVAQQNWAAVPCFRMKSTEGVTKMLFDSLHNQIILNSAYGSKICNTTYKGIFAYDGSRYFDLDFGVNTHNASPMAGGTLIWNSITFGTKTLYGGGFYTVGSATLHSKGLALWNGAVWDTFPVHCFPNTLDNRGGGFYGFLKYNGKLWMYGRFDTLGGVVTKHIGTFDGASYGSVPPVPVNTYNYVSKMVTFRNKLVAAGFFYDYPSFDYYRLAQFDGQSWSQMGGGVRGALAACHDMTVYNDTLYVAGAFSKAEGNAGNYIMKWDGTQLLDAGFGDFCGWGAVWRTLVYRNRLYAFGGFDCANNQRSFGVAYYENGRWTVPSDSFSAFITGAEVLNGDLYIGGFFKSINGDTTLQNFVKLLCPDFDARTGCISGIKTNTTAVNLKIYPNPTTSRVRVEGAAGTIDQLSITNTLGQQILKLPWMSDSQEMDLSGFAAGIYLLKVEGPQGSTVYKLLKE